MCECNCLLSGDFFKLRAPNIGNEKRWYVVQKYPGCKNCSTPCGVMFFELPESHPEFQTYCNCPHITIAKTDVMTFFSQEQLQTQLNEYLREYFKTYELLDSIDADTASEEFAQQFMDRMNK